jgi:hypothetical protein
MNQSADIRRDGVVPQGRSSMDSLLRLFEPLWLLL